MASEGPPDAFLSYTRFDDNNDGGAISEFCKRLANAVRAATGQRFEIFQDVDGIGLGERWRGKLDRELDQARFFIPIITPSYFTSKACREELERFLLAEYHRGRDDLVLPIYYIESEILEEEERRAADPLARIIHERQRQDWRGLRFEPFDAKEVRQELARLAAEIVRARRRTVPPEVGQILGSLSSRYESGQNPGSYLGDIGDADGVWYGTYQLSSRPDGGTVARFLADVAFPWRHRFAGLKPGTPEFSAEWTALAAEVPDTFGEAQHAFIKRTCFDPLVRRVASEDGLDVTVRSRAVQEVIWSIAVQYRPNTPVVHNAILDLGGTDALQQGARESDRRLIVAIYAERDRRTDAGDLAYFSNASKAVQDGLIRRLRYEERDALAMLDSGVVNH